LKWPRVYAAEIIAMKSIEERRKALANVPDPFKDMVKKYVTNEFTMRKYRK